MSTPAAVSFRTSATWVSCDHCKRVTVVTALGQTAYYLPLIGSMVDPARETEMAKFYCFVAALVVFAPMALATLNQAAQIVA